MKKIFIILPILLFGFNSFAAMTCTDAGHVVDGRSGNKVIVVTCSFDTTPGTAICNLPATVMDDLDGKYVYSFAVKPGATGPTDNSDLQIVDSRGITIVSASVNGKDVIDNTTSTGPFYGDGPAGNHYPKGHFPYVWTVTVTNNAVNNSSFTLYMEVGD